VGDVARANVLAFDHGDNDIFCIGTGKGTSVNQIYAALETITGYTPEIVHAPKRPGDIHLAYFNCAKAERILSWKPEVGMEEGIKATVDYFRQIP
jgi:UDP-glucose 4-epimerase